MGPLEFELRCRQLVAINIGKFILLMLSQFAHLRYRKYVPVFLILKIMKHNVSKASSRYSGSLRSE